MTINQMYFCAILTFVRIFLTVAGIPSAHSSTTPANDDSLSASRRLSKLDPQLSTHGPGQPVK